MLLILLARCYSIVNVSEDSLLFTLSSDSLLLLCGCLEPKRATPQKKSKFTTSFVRTLCQFRVFLHTQKNYQLSAQAM